MTKNLLAVHVSSMEKTALVAARHITLPFTSQSDNATGIAVVGYGCTGPFQYTLPITTTRLQAANKRT